MRQPPGGRARRADVEAQLASAVGPLSFEAVPVRRCADRVLAADVAATVDVPDFARSAVDGLAVRAQDLAGGDPESPVVLRVGAVLTRAGGTAGRLAPAETHPVATGAPVPEGADAVVMIEDVAHPDAASAAFSSPIASGKNVIAVGEDVTHGQRLFAEGRRLRPQDAAVLAAIGVDAVQVRRRPAVRIVVTGDEIVPSLELRTAPSQIVDTNSITVGGLARRDGALVDGPFYVGDDPAATREAIVRPGADVVIVTGGSSVGVEDHAPRVLAEVGELLAHGIAIRPGTDGVRPRGRGVGLLLPGHLVACLVGYEVVAGPVIRRLGGRPLAWPHRRARARLASNVESALGRADYVRVAMEGEHARPIRGGASSLSSTVHADGAFWIDEDRERVLAGELVEVLLYDG